MRSDSPIVPTVVCFLLPLMLVFVGMEVSMAHSGEAEPPTVTAPENQSLSPNDPAARAADGGRLMPAADSGFAHKPARDPNRPPGDALEPVDWPMLRDAHWRNFLIGAGDS